MPATGRWGRNSSACCRRGPTWELGIPCGFCPRPFIASRSRRPRGIPQLAAYADEPIRGRRGSRPGVGSSQGSGPASLAVLGNRATQRSRLVRVPAGEPVPLKRRGRRLCPGLADSPSRSAWLGVGTGVAIKALHCRGVALGRGPRSSTQSQRSCVVLPPRSVPRPAPRRKPMGGLRVPDLARPTVDPVRRRRTKPSPSQKHPRVSSRSTGQGGGSIGTGATPATRSPVWPARSSVRPSPSRRSREPAGTTRRPRSGFFVDMVKRCAASRPSPEELERPRPFGSHRRARDRRPPGRPAG